MSQDTYDEIASRAPRVVGPLGDAGLVGWSMGDGTPIVLIHGFPLDGRLWLSQLPALARHGHALALDLRGFGASPPHAGGPLTMERHADDVASVIAALDAGPAIVVGLSMGGYVALALWERHRDAIAGLVLADTRAGADDEAGRIRRDEMATAVVTDGRAALYERLAPALLGPSASLTARARLRTMVEETTYETILGALAGMRDRPDRSSLLPGIAVPTLVVVGEHDALTPPDVAQEMADAIDGARRAIVEGAGHLPPLEEPAATAEILGAFVARVSSG